MSEVDLHIHTNVSDGADSPEDIIHLACEHGLKYISITDHDNIDGIAPAIEAARDTDIVEVIPGVEINTDIHEIEVHILGYYIDIGYTGLTELLNSQRSFRVERNRLMVERLRKLGFNINFDRAMEIAGGGTVGRPHIAQAMVEKGYVQSTSEAFDRFLSRGGPAYFPRNKLTPPEAVAYILAAGGVPVLAHPAGTPDNLITDLVKTGLMGLEVYYPDYDQVIINYYLNLAAKYELIVTGGSDFHGYSPDREKILGELNVPLSVVSDLKNAQLAKIHRY